MNTLYCFLAAEGLLFLKRGYLPFSSPENLPEPWLQPGCVYLTEDTMEVSAQDYRRFLQLQYQNLPSSLKEMMSFDYFEQQSEVKREEIEQSLIAQKTQAMAVKPFSVTGLNDWRILSIFNKWQDFQLWQSLAASGQGLVIEFGVEASGFKSSSYNEQAQHFSAVKHVGSWLPEDDLYYVFNRPQEDQQDRGEWRLVRKAAAADRHVNVKGDSRAMYRLPCKAVTRIILGYRCSPEYCLQVKRYLSQDINYRHTQCVQAQLDPKTLCLQLVAI